MRRCIYCLEEKLESAFNREHVMPEAFGKFEGNLVLECVCWDCDDYFGRELDLKLARDTLEGIERVRFGLVKPADFKTLGKKSTTRVQFAKDGPLKGAWGYNTLDRTTQTVVVTPFPQIGFSATADSPVQWFLANEVPHKSVIGSLLGLVEGDLVHIHTEAIEFSEAQEALTKAGYRSPTMAKERAPVVGLTRVDTVGVVGAPEFRAVTKISMNYLAAVAGAATALMPHFNEARRYARYAVAPTEKLVVNVERERWSATHNETGEEVVGHHVCVEAIGQLVAAQVSLLGRLRYTVALARGGFAIQLAIASGHYFDLKTRRAVPGPRLPLRMQSS